MKVLVLTVCCLLSGLALFSKETYQPQQGDVVFQSLPNPLGLDLVDAIEGATGSPYSHCGMVMWEDGQWNVIEAIGPVQIISLAQWRNRGRGKKLWVYRLDQANLVHVPKALAAMKRNLGKPYDPRYRFDADAIYCSELIYRGWMSATGKALGKTVQLGELNWQPYQRVIAAIEGTTEIPLQREMITPRDLATAPELTRVYPASNTKRKWTFLERKTNGARSPQVVDGGLEVVIPTGSVIVESAE